jgi:hypothetical protein
MRNLGQRSLVAGACSPVKREAEPFFLKRITNEGMVTQFVDCPDEVGAPFFEHRQLSFAIVRIHLLKAVEAECLNFVCGVAEVELIDKKARRPAGDYGDDREVLCKLDERLNDTGAWVGIGRIRNDVCERAVEVGEDAGRFRVLGEPLKGECRRFVQRGRVWRGASETNRARRRSNRRRRRRWMTSGSYAAASGRSASRSSIA